MRPMRTRLTLAALPTLASIVLSFPQLKTAETPPASKLVVDLDRITVATVGPISITASEFKSGYEFGPAFPKRESRSKERYLNYLVYEKLLALDARQRGLDIWPDLRRQVSEIQGDLATEELYRDDILKGVKPGARLIADAVGRERRHLSVRWIFCSSAPEVDSVVRAMKSGATFDSLYSEQIAGKVKPDDRSMETTAFRLRLKNPAFASVTESLKPGAVSLPVHGPDGWYFVQITKSWTSPVGTQSENERILADVRRSLTQYAADSLSDAYVGHLMTGEHPTIMRGPFNAIEAYLGAKFLDKKTMEEWKLSARMGAKNLRDPSDIESIAPETLVVMKSRTISVGDFLGWFRMREPYVKMELSRQEGFFQSAENLVWQMVRDRLLTQRAYERGYQNRASVKRETEWWREKMLYIANKQRIGDTIEDSTSSLMKFYGSHERLFADDSGHVRPFADVREDVWKQYYSSELTKRMLHEILRLKQQYRVRVDSTALQAVAVSEENDPKAIDVYSVKSRGIYPRMAFPSIDYDWVTWE